MRKRGDTHLEVEAVDASEKLVIVPNLLDDTVGATHNAAARIMAGTESSLSCVTVQSDDRLKGLWRYDPTRPKVRNNGTVDREEFCDLLSIGTADVATTHSCYSDAPFIWRENLIDHESRHGSLDAFRQAQAIFRHHHSFAFSNSELLGATLTL